MATVFPDELRPADIATVAGTPAEVLHKLEEMDAGQVIALTVGHDDPEIARMVANAVISIAPLIVSTLANHERQTLDKIVEALVPQVPPAPHLVIEARMRGEARKAAFEAGDWVTAAEISEMAGFNSSNASAQPHRWKKDGRIFAVRRNGTDYYPGYALDPGSGYRPVKGLRPILETLGDSKDDWGLAIWFASANSFLGGRAPKDLLLTQSDHVLAAAQDEAAGVLHG